MHEQALSTRTEKKEWKAKKATLKLEYLTVGRSEKMCHKVILAGAQHLRDGVVQRILVLLEPASDVVRHLSGE